MKPLATQFRHNGFHFRQINREGDFALFEQTKGTVTAYEVVKITRHNGFAIGAKKFPPAEMYPPASQWGSSGWTYTDKESAMRKLTSLVNAVNRD